MPMTSENSRSLFVHRSATRRKACNGCVKAKRRCDLVLPSCLRCRARNLSCVYLDEHGKPFPPKGKSLDCEKRTSKPDDHDKACAFMRGSSERDGSTTKLTITPSGTLVHTAKDTERMTFYNGIYLSLKFFEPEALTKQQINYLVAQLRHSINAFVSDGQNAFIHAHYQESMPIVYQDALSVCGLYVQKTDQNQATIFRILESKIAALLQAPVSTRVEDNLLALQALILYQIIRLFDGELRQRSNAEHHLELLDVWTLRLQRSYFQAVFGLEIGYGEWVLIESIRRTTMISVMLRCLYCAMKDGFCPLVPLLASLSVSTKSSRLWKMAEDEWYKAKNSSPVLTYAEFTDEWNKGNVNGVEDYEKLLLMACKYANVAGKVSCLA